MHYNCFIVDDEEQLAKATCEYFQMFDVSCSYATNAAACESFLKENSMDVLLLDINLGEESGFALCKKLRETLDIPILFISARQSDDDVLIALNIGGDDYIKKPYSLSVLLAKVKVIMKRNGSRVSQQSTDAKIILNPDLRSATVEGREVSLRAKEYQLFAYLYKNANRIITKDELFAAVWGDAFFSDGTLNVHIRKLREKLELDANDPKLIKTIWGTGYLLEL